MNRKVRKHRRWPIVAHGLWTALFILWMVAVANAEPEKTGDPLYDAGAEIGNDLGQQFWGVVGVVVWLIGTIVILVAAIATRSREKVVYLVQQPSAPLTTGQSLPPPSGPRVG